MKKTIKHKEGIYVPEISRVMGDEVGDLSDIDGVSVEKKVFKLTHVTIKPNVLASIPIGLGCGLLLLPSWP